MSPFTEHYAIRLWSAPSTSRYRLQFDSLTGYSVCTNRCNIRCGYGSFLSMVTSHLLAVPNTESTNCYNLWLVCLRHLQPLARHSLSSSLGLCINLRLLSPASFLRLRHKFFPTLVLPCACSTITSGGLPRIWKFSLPYSLELA